MALVKCKECGKEISNKAIKCPNCGYNNNKSKKGLKLLLIIVATLVLVLGVLFLIQNNSKKINEDYKMILIIQDECNHCESLQPKVEEISNEYKLTLDIINTKDLTDYSYNGIEIEGTPTLLLFNDENFITKKVGDTSKEEILVFLKSNGFIRE